MGKNGKLVENGIVLENSGSAQAIIKIDLIKMLDKRRFKNFDSPSGQLIHNSQMYLKYDKNIRATEKYKNLVDKYLNDPDFPVPLELTLRLVIFFERNPKEMFARI